MLRHMIGAILGLAIISGGCEKKEPAPPKTGSPTLDSLKKSAGDAGKKTDAALADTREKAGAAGDSALQEMSKQLETLRSKASSASADNKPAIEAAVKDLDTQLANARTQLQAMKNASTDTWPKASADFQQTLSRARDSFKTAMDKYGK